MIPQHKQKVKVITTRTKAIIFTIISLIVNSLTFAQKTSREDVMLSVRKIADNVIRNTTYMYYDRQAGVLIEDIQKYGYNKYVQPQNGYNDWKYWNGVIHIGFNALGAETKEAKYSQYAKKNFEFFFKDYAYFKSIYDGKDPWGFPLAQAAVIRELDDCGAMGASLVELYMTEKKPEYKAYIDAASEHILKQQTRLSNGILSRRTTVWADDLYMSVPFLARMGKMTGDMSYFDEAAKQVILFNELLFDTRVGLMWHCYYDDLKVNGGTYWGRCNGWIMMATADLLRLMPENHPQRTKMIDLLNRQIRNIAQYQSQTGMWHQVLHKSDSYLETSCTAMFSYAIALAVNNNWVDRRYRTIALAGWEGIQAQITNEGGVMNICEGTGLGNDIKFYYDRPAPYNDIHGLGAVFLAGLEIYKLIN